MGGLELIVNLKQQNSVLVALTLEDIAKNKTSKVISDANSEAEDAIKKIKNKDAKDKNALSIKEELSSDELPTPEFYPSEDVGFNPASYAFESYQSESTPYAYTSNSNESEYVVSSNFEIAESDVIEKGQDAISQARNSELLNGVHPDTDDTKKTDARALNTYYGFHISFVLYTGTVFFGKG